MAGSSEVTIERDGKQFGATYCLHKGMLEVKTHTETRSIEIGDRDPAALARQMLTEIVEAQSHK